MGCKGGSSPGRQFLVGKKKAGCKRKGDFGGKKVLGSRGARRKDRKIPEGGGGGQLIGGVLQGKNVVQ